MADIALGPDDDGGTVTAHVGDRLVVTVPENATTGYQWEVEAVDGSVDLDTFDAVPPRELRPGQGGARRVVAHAAREGEGRLRLRLRRSWEPAERAAQSYAVTVAVKAG
jgi:inhibitor of cysteine peptidase